MPRPKRRRLASPTPIPRSASLRGAGAGARRLAKLVALGQGRLAVGPLGPFSPPPPSAGRGALQPLVCWVGPQTLAALVSGPGTPLGSVSPCPGAAPLPIRGSVWVCRQGRFRHHSKASSLGLAVAFRRRHATGSKAGKIGPRQRQEPRPGSQATRISARSKKETAVQASQSKCEAPSWASEAKCPA